MNEIIIRPIGFVRNGINEGGGMKTWLDTRSELVLDKEYYEALYNIGEYSHVVVVFWMHKISNISRALKRIAPPYAPESVGERGVFATRVPTRPNPIGISAVPLIKRRKNVLIVKNLDAFDGTPVLDVKPYTGHILEHPKDFHIPEWESSV